MLTLDIEETKRLITEALSRETKESMIAWIDEHRQKVAECRAGGGGGEHIEITLLPPISSIAVATFSPASAMVRLVEEPSSVVLNSQNPKIFYPLAA